MELKSGWPKVGERRWMGISELSQGRASTCTSSLLRDHADLTHNSYTAHHDAGWNYPGTVITCSTFLSGGRCRHGSGPAGDDRSQSQIMAGRWY